MTIPPYVPPVTNAGTLNGQKELSKQVKTIAAASTTIPIVYGEAQVGGRVFAATYTGGYWYVGALFCVGEIDSFTALYLDGVDVKPATPDGMTITYYTGTTSQTADATLASAISGYTDTLVVTNGGGSVGLAYVVLKYNESHYSGFPTIMAKIKGLKIHNVSANLIANSEDISSAGWALGNADSGSSLNATTAPDATTTADKLTEATVTSANHFIAAPAVSNLPPNSVATFSVFLKSSERTFARLQFLCQDGTTAVATFNLTTGLIESSSGANFVDAQSVNYGLGWFRVSVTANVNTGATAPRGRILIMQNATTQTYAGTIGSGIFVWGAQLEEKRSAGVYTKTTGTASTAAWSDNPALCARDLILNPVFGLGEDVDDLTVKCAATECDALVTTEKRRTLNLVIDSARSATDWIDTLATYAGAWIYKSGGRWTFKPDRPAFLWQFTSTTHSFTAANGTLASGATAATFTQTAADQILYTPAFFSAPEALNICGRLARYVRARIRRTSGAGAVDTTLFYRTAFHGESVGYYKATTAWTAANGTWAIREWDMHSPTAGGDDWEESIIGGIRIDFTNSAATDVWEIDWISVGVEPITTAGVVAGSFSAGTADAAQVPTIIRVDYTDTSTTEYKTRPAYAETTGVSTGTVQRRESVVQLPGVTRYSQAYREAAERLAKLNNSLHCEFTRFDEGLATEVGDVLSVMHPYVDTASTTECAEATLFLVTDAKVISPGRVRVRATKYDTADYDNSENSTTWGAYTRRAGNLGGSGDGINRIPGRFAGGFSVLDPDGELPVTKEAGIASAAVVSAVAGVFGSYSLQITAGATAGNKNTFLCSPIAYTIPIDPNSKWIISAKFRPIAANTSVSVSLKTSAGNTYSLLSTTNTANVWNDITNTATGKNVLDLTADASTTAQVILTVNATSTSVHFDGLMLEKKIGNGTTPSAWRPPVASSSYPARIKTADLSGTLSGASITPSTIGATAFASSIEPVTLVTSVPGTKSTSTIFNTTDGKLYRWNGTAYVASVTGSDIVAGTLAATAFANTIEPVTIVTAAPLPTTKSTSTIFYQPDGKLYRWNGSAYAASIPSTDVTASWITAGAISAGAINANEIAAGAITASKLAVVDMTNMVKNPSFQGASSDGWTLNGGTVVQAKATAGVPSGAPSEYVLKNPLVVNTNNDSTANGLFDVRPGEVYYVEWYAASDAAANGVNRIFLQLTDQTGTGLTWPAAATTPTNSTTWTRYSGQITIPATFVYNSVTYVPARASINFGAVGGASAAGNWYVTKFHVRKAATAELVVDGAITTNKLDALAVTAGKIAVGAVGADQIAANAITVGKLAVTGVGPSINSDPLAQDSSAWATLLGTPVFLTGLADAPAGSTAIANTSGAYAVAVTADYMPIDQNKKYRLNAWLDAIAGTAGTGALGVIWYDANKVQLNSNVAQPTGAGSPSGWTNGTYSFFFGGTGGAVVPTTWTKYSIAFGTSEAAAIPTNARFMRVVCRMNQNATAGAQIGLTSLRLMEKSDGDLIVDGSITATKLSVTSLSSINANIGTVTAGLLQSSTGSAQVDLTNAKIIFNNGSYMKVTGIGFGASSNYLEWYGPTVSSASNFAACTDANAIYYLKTTGVAYFGGTTESPKVTRTYRAQTTTFSATETVPLGVTKCVIELFGAGGGGGAGTGTGNSGGGGGSGSYSRTTVTVTAGSTFTMSLAPLANGGASGGNGGSAASSTISGSLITTMTAPGGGGGVGTTGGSTAGAAAAIATGGTDSNLTGVAGTAGGAPATVPGGAGRAGYTETGANGGTGSNVNINTGPGQSGDNFFAILGYRVGAQAVFRYF